MAPVYQDRDALGEAGFAPNFFVMDADGGPTTSSGLAGVIVPNVIVPNRPDEVVGSPDRMLIAPLTEPSGLRLI